MGWGVGLKPHGLPRPGRSVNVKYTFGIQSVCMLKDTGVCLISNSKVSTFLLENTKLGLLAIEVS